MLRFIPKIRRRNLSLSVFNNVRRRTAVLKTETDINKSIPIPSAFFETVPTLNQYIRELNYVNLVTNNTDSDYIDILKKQITEYVQILDPVQSSSDSIDLDGNKNNGQQWESFQTENVQ